MRVTWQVNDGYLNAGRTHTTDIDDEDLAACANDREREDFIADCIQDDFAEKVSWSEVSRSE